MLFRVLYSMWTLRVNVMFFKVLGSLLTLNVNVMFLKVLSSMFTLYFTLESLSSFLLYSILMILKVFS